MIIANAIDNGQQKLATRLFSVASILLLLTAPATAEEAKTCHEASGAVALAACDRAIASGQHSGRDLARLHTSRGVERRRAGNLVGALADYTEAIRIDPKDHFAYNNRANLRRDQGDLEAAIADYTEALRLDPGYTAAYVNRGLVHERRKDVGRARADFQEAISRPPKYGNGPGGQRIARERLAALGATP